MQQQQQSLSPKFLGSTIDPHQISQGQPHVFFFSILFYLNSYLFSSLIDMSFFATSADIIFGLPLPFFFLF